MASDSQSLEALKIDKRAKAPGSVPAWLWLIVGLIVVVAIGGWWWARTPRAIPVKTVTVEQPKNVGSGSTVLNASGYVTARRRATVSSKVTGRVVEVLVEEGKGVRAGQVLARLDPTTAERNLALTRAELVATERAVAENRVRLEQARLNLQRARSLRADGIVNQSELDNAETEVRAFEARLALTEEQVHVVERQVALRETERADLVITAPFNGVAISKDAQPGEMISPVSAGGGFTRTGICTIVDMTSLEIEVDVNESYINRVASGQRIEATLDAYPDWRIPGKVITMVPTADRQKATVLVRIGFDQLDPRILPDMGVKVAFLGAEAPKAVLPPMTVPKTAIRTDGGSQVVFVVTGDSRLERRAVRVGSTKDDRVEIVSGLSSGEAIVTESPGPLKDGDRVVVVK
ncbi:MAG TPA: efflux RND transporter periplasmic adaptor subunit [Vicinamibacterales bacterium]|jgi:RND family efflux transporter MFP subunit